MPQVKICIPVSAKNREGLSEELEYIRDKDCHIVEWRFDYWEENNKPAPADLLGRIKGKSGSKLLLFTYRTKAEGGFASEDETLYYNVNMNAIKSGYVDILDIEFEKRQPLIERLLAAAAENRVKTMLSKHLHEVNINKDELVGILRKMQDIGGDTIKLAVSVSDEKDARELMSAAKEMYEKYAKVPIVTIGMGEAGKITRLTEPFYGSSITFIRGLRETAAGQLSYEELSACGAG